MTALKINKKVKMNLEEQGRSKTWLANKMGITRQLLHTRLNDNFWSDSDISKLKELGII